MKIKHLKNKKNVTESFGISDKRFEELASFVLKSSKKKAKDEQIRYLVDHCETIEEVAVACFITGHAIGCMRKRTSVLMEILGGIS